MASISNSRRIAQNTVILYIRTAVVLLVSLYTSRLVFQSLGESDLGIYNLVAGIVTLMTFLQSAQTQATSRFITYSLGEHSSKDSQSNIFAICVTNHFIIAIAAIVFTETLGLWAVNNWTSIPGNRVGTANIVYQFSILTLVIQTIRTPLDSVVIAHEKMSAYAFMSLLESFLLLSIAIILTHYHGDRLLLYGALVAMVGMIVFIAYFVYVRIKFGYYQFRWHWDKEKSVQVLSFSGWTLLGSGTDTAAQQGVSLLLNNFVGLVANTALGFAQQVNNAIRRFVTSFSTAFTPQVIKLFAEGNTTDMHILVRRASKFSFVLCYAIALPLIANMPFVLDLWLGDVPMLTTDFCQMILICSIFDAITGVFYTSINATGRIRNFQIWISISFLLDLLCAFLLLKSNIKPSLVFGSRIITRGVFNMLIELYFMKKYLSFDIKTYLGEVMFPISLTLAVSIPAIILVCKVTTGWHQLIFTTLLSTLLIGFCSYIFILNKREKTAIIQEIRKRLRHSHN